MIRMLILSVLTLAASGAQAQSQERTPASPVTPLKVQVVLSRYDGEKKLSSMPYTLLVNAGDRDNRVTLRMGVSLPVTGVGASGPTVAVHDIGTNMDCTASPADGGRFRIGLAVNHSSVFETDERHLQATIPKPGDSAKLDAMKRSIEACGQLEPIRVYERGEHQQDKKHKEPYILCFGNRRCRAIPN